MTFTVTCRRCGAQAQGLNLVGLFTTPDLCPACEPTDHGECECFLCRGEREAVEEP